MAMTKRHKPRLGPLALTCPQCVVMLTQALQALRQQRNQAQAA